MNAFRRGNTSIRPARQSSPARLFLVLMAVAALVGVLVLTRSEATAQSTGSTQGAATASAPAGNAQRGKALYTRVGCWECHGLDGQSGNPKLGPPPMPFPAFTNQLRSPRSTMPPYTAKVLSDAEVADLYAFAQSLPPSPKLESIPLLQQ